MLFSDFTNIPQIDYSLFVIGEEYYLMGVELINQQSQDIEMRLLFSKAIEIWERIIAQLPETSHAAHSFYSIGMIHYHFKEYADAIMQFIALIQEWPKYYKTPDAVSIADDVTMNCGRMAV